MGIGAAHVLKGRESGVAMQCQGAVARSRSGDAAPDWREGGMAMWGEDAVAMRVFSLRGFMSGPDNTQR
jgi:hypothetical protein